MTATLTASVTGPIAPDQTRTETPSADRRTARIAGALYLATFVGSIPALPLYHDILKDRSYVLHGGSDTGVLIGALLEIICALSGIGTAVVLYRVVKRHSPTRGLGFIASRTFEATMICVGVLNVLALVTLHKAAGGASGGEATSLVTTSQGLVAVHDWTFLVGPGLMPAVNALCLATVLYRTRLVPRIIPTLGIIGAPLLTISSISTLFGAFEQVSGPAFFLALPIAAWELSLGLWMLIKGFTPPSVPVEASDSSPLAAA